MLCSFTLNLFYFYPNTPRAAGGGGWSSVWLWLLLCQSPHTKRLCYQLSEWDAVWPAGSAIVLLRRLSFIVSWISSLSSAGCGRQQLPCAAHFMRANSVCFVLNNINLPSVSLNDWNRHLSLSLFMLCRTAADGRSWWSFYQCRNPPGINRKCLVKLSWFSTLYETLRVWDHFASCLQGTFKISVLDDV